MRKVQRKLEKLAYQQKQLDQRLAKMTPAERTTYDAWQKSHEPSTGERRASRREDIRRSREFRADIARREGGLNGGSTTPEIQDLLRRIELLKRQIAADEKSSHLVYRGGVFD